LVLIHIEKIMATLTNEHCRSVQPHTWKRDLEKINVDSMFQVQPKEDGGDSTKKSWIQHNNGQEQWNRMNIIHFVPHAL